MYLNFIAFIFLIKLNFSINYSVFVQLLQIFKNKYLLKKMLNNNTKSFL
jgi:hypothetical protein